MEIDSSQGKESIIPTGRIRVPQTRVYASMIATAGIVFDKKLRHQAAFETTLGPYLRLSKAQASVGHWMDKR